MYEFAGKVVVITGNILFSLIVRQFPPPSRLHVQTGGGRFAFDKFRIHQIYWVFTQP
jgi:hypothetical protein